MREPSEPAKALIIEAELVTRGALTDKLEAAGFDTNAATTASAGIESFNETPADVVLIDLALPADSALEACRAIRAMPGGETAIIVVTAASEDARAVALALDAGATDFMRKPTDLSLLQQRLAYARHNRDSIARLSRTQAVLDSSQRLARLGSWELELDNGHFEYTDQLHAMFCDVDESRLRTLENILARVCEEDRSGVMKRYRDAIDNAQDYEMDFRLRGADGETVHVHQATAFERNPVGEPVRALGVFQDVTESRNSEARMRELAFHDPVTGLPNRVFFMERLTEVMALARRSRRCMALMFVDLDQFKRVNDTYGHQAGDELLRQVSERLTDSLRRCDVLSRVLPEDDRTVARLGGDEFVVLLSEIRRADDAAVVAHRLLQALKQPFDIDGKEVSVSCSIGISTFPQDGTTEDELLHHADTAMYRVKEEGRNGFRFFEMTMNSRAFERLNLETSLWRAFERGEFALHYQPQVSPHRNEVLGAEALVRWEHPDFGTISPAQFLPVAEEIGLMLPLGEWIVEQACYQLAAWRCDGLRLASVSVNISPSQYLESSLFETTLEAIKASGIEPGMLCVELAEHMLDADDLERTEQLVQLADVGVRIAVDDFGTGSASLTNLRLLPVSSLKIARGFVRDIARERRDGALVKGAIELARALDLSTVAAGVEDAAQLDILTRHNCELLQGYHFSPAISAGAFAEWFEAYKRVQPTIRATA